MSDERKRLMPEILPGPGPAVSSTSVRQRVVRHMKLLIATGAATTTLVACPYGVVDPLPPPARCRTTGSVLDDLQVTAQSVSSGEVVVDLYLDAGGYGEVKLLRVDQVLGAVTTQVKLEGYPAQVYLRPDSKQSTITLTVTAECVGLPAQAVRIELRPVSSDAHGTNYAVTVSEALPPDAGP
jgi:hypothetical protein